MRKGRRPQLQSIITLQCNAGQALWQEIRYKYLSTLGGYPKSKGPPPQGNGPPAERCSVATSGYLERRWGRGASSTRDRSGNRSRVRVGAFQCAGVHRADVILDLIEHHGGVYVGVREARPRHRSNAGEARLVRQLPVDVVCHHIGAAARGPGNIHVRHLNRMARRLHIRRRIRGSGRSTSTTAPAATTGVSGSATTATTASRGGSDYQERQSNTEKPAPV